MLPFPKVNVVADPVTAPPALTTVPLMDVDGVVPVVTSHVADVFTVNVPAIVPVGDAAPVKYFNLNEVPPFANVSDDPDGTDILVPTESVSPPEPPVSVTAALFVRFNCAMVWVGTAVAETVAVTLPSNINTSATFGVVRALPEPFEAVFQLVETFHAAELPPTQ